MRWIKFKHMFHKSWHVKMRKFIESKECDEIYNFLKSESKLGHNISPSSSNVYRAFFETDIDNLKAVLVGHSPFPEFVDGTPIADGLLLGCSVTEKLHPYLNSFYRGLEKDLYNGLNLGYEKTTDVTYLAKQGVLMLNSSLTTDMDNFEAHSKVWEPFMKFVFEEFINITGVPVVFLGEKAKELQKYREEHAHDYTVIHPGTSVRRSTEWETHGLFSEIDVLMLNTNGPLMGVQWLDMGVPY
jgi:uracil-DNA glycosylase